MDALVNNTHHSLGWSLIIKGDNLSSHNLEQLLLQTAGASVSETQGIATALVTYQHYCFPCCVRGVIP